MEDQHLPDQLPQINGDDFYEKIEAPKFVDFTAPDRRPPDDRYWFCLRVGCDQKHEEEVDSEEIYKNFVLRVMAARSPNIRLQKALCRKPSILPQSFCSSPKCPLTAPAKPSKSRIARLAVISSISRKLVNGKDETRPVKKITATPKTTLKPSSTTAKAFTTPRNRKRISNPDKFRSVRNPKPTSIAVPKTRVLAKALVFHSPKKSVKFKTSTELKTPVRKLCAARSKLELASGKKQPLELKTPMGKLCVAMSKLDIASGKKQALPLGATSRKQFRAREVKSRVYDSLNSHNHKGQEAKSLKNVKRKKREKDLEIKQSCKDNKDGSSDMEIDEKRARGGSLEGCSQSGGFNDGETNGNAECLKTVKTSKLPSDEHPVEALLETSREDLSSLPSSEERPSENGDQAITNDSSDQAEKTKSCEEKENHTEDGENDDKENSFPFDDKENDGENESAEKENDSASDGNREPHSCSDGEILSNQDTKKDNQATKKTLKKSSIAATGAQEAKYRKPKPTNPKPFRLRTDERGILKETNLEKKRLTPLKEIKSVKPSGKSSRKHPNLSQAEKNESCQGQSEDGNVIREENRKRLDQPGRAKTCSRTLKGNLEQNSSPAMHSRRFLASSVSEKSSERTKESASSRKTARLRVIKERSKTILRNKEVMKLCENGALPSSKASASTAPRSVSRGRRPTTIAKEPNFHSIHVPKSCTKKVA